MATQQQRNQKTTDVTKAKDQNNAAQSPEMVLVDDISNYLTEYAKQRPGAVALWTFGLGFVIGWKLKPW